ncbi:type II secretion system protein GspL [Neiella marina]|uniref:Type II secretion system protein L n=1 Tax=Neiella holothuriorum TaxID=2870530 RepID=A0ABS7EGC8_9GAMM|nr:type II secretion system protein GspL [Neiella holothuriorum]MBW8191264.1 type II secretion system protein GspL [Neiella holothuriorum]
MRLTSHSDQAIPWLVWSQRERDVIASGELADADHLHELQTWSADRQIIALAPLQDCGLAQLAVPKKNRRQAMAALPYMLEDDLAEDVEQIHLTVTAQLGDEVGVCFVSHSKMELWLSWFQNAELQVGKIVPDVLALPLQDEQWHAAQLGDNWLIRQGSNQGVVLDDDDWFAAWWRQAELPEQGLVAHTPWPQEHSSDAVITELAELPLASLVDGAIHTNINLRHGQYRIRNKRTPQALRPWLSVAALAAIALTLYLINVGLRISELNHQANLVQAEVENTYKIAFPKAKRFTNLRAQMRQKLKEAGGGSGSDHGFLSALHDLADTLRAIDGLTIESLKFDSKRKEVRIQAVASDFQQFEQFKSAIIDPYQAEVGALNKSNGKVNGTLTIRRVS